VYGTKGAVDRKSLGTAAVDDDIYDGGEDDDNDNNNVEYHTCFSKSGNSNLRPKTIYPE
jgi:hypothetical protein